MEAAVDLIIEGLDQASAGSYLAVMAGLVTIVAGLTQLLKTKFGARVMKRLPKKYRPFVPVALGVLLSVLTVLAAGLPWQAALKTIFVGVLPAWAHDVRKVWREFTVGESAVGGDDAVGGGSDVASG